MGVSTTTWISRGMPSWEEAGRLGMVGDGWRGSETKGGGQNMWKIRRRSGDFARDESDGGSL
jgi:hypothetical protein